MPYRTELEGDQTVTRCAVMEQKETDSGMKDEPCNRFVESAGLCKYVLLRRSFSSSNQSFLPQTALQGVPGHVDLPALHRPHFDLLRGGAGAGASKGEHSHSQSEGAQYGEHAAGEGGF